MTRRFIGHQHFKSRGALSNPAGRFDAYTIEASDDGWFGDDNLAHVDEVVLPDHARSIITTNDSPDVGFDASINPYRGCAHACVYCFARPTHAYLGLSPGLDFETKLFFKEGAVERLETELSKRSYVCKPVALGINTDAYQPLERRLGITRSILEVLARLQHPVSIITKSALIVRDADLLAEMAKARLVSVMLSITSLSSEIKRTLEPRTASPQARLRVIEQLSRAGIPVGVMVAPVIPGITDHEMEDILAAARDAGASCASYVLLRLPHEVKILFREWLLQHFPDRAKHVMSLINQARGGKDYDSTYGVRMRGTGPYAKLLGARFELAKRRLDLADSSQRHALDTHKFRPPAAAMQQILNF